MSGPTDRRLLIVVGIIGLFGIITFILAAATLGTLNRRYDTLNQHINDVKNLLSTPTTTTSVATTTTTTTTLQSITTTTTTAEITNQTLTGL